MKLSFNGKYWGGNMSGWGAIDPGGEAIHAWEFRALYLATGERHSAFSCPFCGIRLAPYLIYEDGELSKSPHFSARWEGHIGDCNGEAIYVDEAERKPVRAHYLPRGMRFPEALVDRPPHRVQVPRPVAAPVQPPSPAEILARRNKAGSLGKPVPSTCVLQAIVEAFNAALAEIYKQADKSNWNDDKRKAEIRNALSSMPLRLQDRTNYADGIRSPSFPSSRCPRIYRGMGVVFRVADGLTINSAKDGKWNGAAMPFQVWIDPNALDGASPQSQRKLYATLEAFAAEGCELRWYAFGLPEFRSDRVVLPIRSLDHLYIKKAFPPKQR
jgi:hypothetical protein